MRTGSYTATTPYAFGIAVDTNNRVTTSGFSYDLSGNLTSDGINAYTWNAESETKTAAGVTYTYDGDGNRVEKSNGTLYWYGLGGEVLTETNLSGGLKADYVYFDGKRIAKHNGSGNNFYLEDHLGSSRVMTTSTGAVCYDADFLPFGQEVDYTNTCGSNYKFEGKERDTETGNDDFGARYYRSLIGRWLSPDWSAIPAPVPYANLTNPQTLNLYAMVSDNPETFADLDGHCWPFCQIVAWASVEVGLEGGKNFAKDVGIGAAKGAGSFVFNSVRTVAAAGTMNPGAVAASLTAPGPVALQPSNEVQGQVSTATQVTLGAASLVAGAAGVSAELGTTTVTHFTDDAAVQAITNSGGTLFEGTHVTLPSEIPDGATSSQVQHLLEIEPGKGANSVTFDTPNSNLVVPKNGPTTSGHAIQFQLKNPTKIDPTKFTKTPQ